MKFRPNRTTSRLQEVPVFAGMAPIRLEHLISRSQLLLLARGEPLFEAGQPCNGLHAVLDGMVKVFARTSSGHEKVLAIAGRGQTLPGTHLIGDAKLPHHASALCDSAVLVIPQDVLQGEITLDPSLGQRLLDDATQHVCRMMREIESTTLSSAMKRTCDYLLRQPVMALQGGDGRDRVICLPVSKGTVASLLSITPEHFSRILRELQASGVIDMQQRTIRILDPDRLARLE